MTDIRYRVACGISAALGRLRTPNRFVERVLGVDYPAEERASILSACRYQGADIGQFYRWKCVQWATMREVMRRDRAGVTRFIATHDLSCYEPLDEALQRPEGLLVATPHYGHFLVSITAIADRSAGRKVVNIFFDAPEKHSANKSFADLGETLYGDREDVNVIFNNRAGLVRALKALRRGEIVVIMPDVFDNVDDTFELSFLGHSRSVALGTATLARVSGSRVLPMVSRAEAQGRFRSCFGEAIVPKPDPGPDRVRQAFHDYALTRSMFMQFEALIERDVIPWQYIRTHFNAPPPLPNVPPGQLAEYLRMFAADPRVRVDLRSPVAVP